MQNKKDKLFDKFVRKNFNNELETILEKKQYNEDAKSFLLSILYKLEAAYSDYAKVKQDVETKEEYIENILEIIQKDCEDIELVKLDSDESKILENKTFLVDKENSKIISYAIERKFLYAIFKIGKSEYIIKDKYKVINKTLSDMINVGNNINNVEPLRDFNGYSWTTIPNEIESINHNIIYQNLRMLLGHKFLNNWVKKEYYIIDYYEKLVNTIQEKYGEENSEKLIQLLINLSIFLTMKFDEKETKKLQNEKEKVDEELEDMENNVIYIERITKQKVKLGKDIKKIDETINDKILLQEEYLKRNEELSLDKKIFSIKTLSRIMSEERKQYINELERLNGLLKPKNFIQHKEELIEKQNYFKLTEIDDLDKRIQENIIELQKIFLSCFEIKMNEIETKQDIIDYIYTYRYYLELQYDFNKKISRVEELKEDIDRVGMKLIRIAHKTKVIEQINKIEENDYKILKNIFNSRIINLDDLYLKTIKDKENYFIQLFDENIVEEKIEIKDIQNINKKDMEIKFNKKIKLFI